MARHRKHSAGNVEQKKSGRRNVEAHEEQVQTNDTTNQGDARKKTFEFMKTLQNAAFRDGKVIVTDRALESGTS